ncbi:SDR family oxidoreductase [Rhizobium sp. L1K21]|uniref:SDR family NAD(P)-dependent oxidoreductase n=1 Tax=Rhizobium sp. L1K21 TaxID=2954933 RepID=UPI002092605E|nr:SDR family NAD(P)-dependent oxidoreductase [Rhizobium sp. L1K21]MCO6186006.1 SDR family NAD(P)-dependent oxidoreductase [Rhizobium sp. L1K21]
MSVFREKVAVVTGAGSGIGRALALGLAERGARVAISDIDPVGLDETDRMLRTIGAESFASTFDVGDASAFAEYAEAVKWHYGVVHHLYNNAGTTLGSRPFLEMRPEHFEKVMNVNFWGVVNGTRVFLPLLIESGEGALVNISSLNGLMAQPELSAYCGSKFAVRGFTETLRAEMMMADHNVHVVVVHPGGVKTNIANSAQPKDEVLDDDERIRAEERLRLYNEKLLKMSPEKAASIILNGVERGRSRIVITREAVVLDWLVRALPQAYPRLVVAAMRRALGK